MARDHRRLRAFKLADEYAFEVYIATRSFPREELYGLTSHIRKTAVSVPSNIVEACGRDSLADYLRFLHIAMGSLREVGYQVRFAHRLGYLDDEKFHQLSDQHDMAARTLGALIRSQSS